MESRNVLLADAASTQVLGRELAQGWLEGQWANPISAPILLLQ